jgi:outer membrane protein OmpA-like peptidoglycan-associated protein
MRHEWTFVIVDGFGTGEVDFPARLAAADQSLRDEVDSQIMSPLVNGVDGVVLVINGHADRVDTGEDHQTSLQREHDASRDRATSAMAAILTMIGRDWLDPGPAAWEDMPQVAVVTNFLGAVRLIDAGGTEAARRRNRRVELAVCRFIP